MKFETEKREILNKNGLQNQVSATIEELLELSIELNKLLQCEGDRKRIVEEMGDVYNMLDQIKLGLSISTREILTMQQKCLKKAQKVVLGNE